MPKQLHATIRGPDFWLNHLETAGLYVHTMLEQEDQTNLTLPLILALTLTNARAGGRGLRDNAALGVLLLRGPAQAEGSREEPGAGQGRGPRARLPGEHVEGGLVPQGEPLLPIREGAVLTIGAATLRVNTPFV